MEEGCMVVLRNISEKDTKYLLLVAILLSLFSFVSKDVRCCKWRIFRERQVEYTRVTTRDEQAEFEKIQWRLVTEKDTVLRVLVQLSNDNQ